MTAYDDKNLQGKVKICAGWEKRPECKTKVTGKGDRCFDCADDLRRHRQNEWAKKKYADKKKAEADPCLCPGQPPG